MPESLIILQGQPSDDPEKLDITRKRAKRWIDRAPEGTRFYYEPAGPSRSKIAKIKAMLNEISAQTEYYGQKLPPHHWQCLFLDLLNRETVLILPQIDGQGFVPVGQTRSLKDVPDSKASDLIELIYKYGAERGVRFKNDPPPAEPER